STPLRRHERKRKPRPARGAALPCRSAPTTGAAFPWPPTSRERRRREPRAESEAGEGLQPRAESEAGEGLQIAAESLLALDGLEEGLEVAVAEAAGAVTLDHLEEERRPILRGFREDLQQIAVVVAVGQDAEPPEVAVVLV